MNNDDNANEERSRFVRETVAADRGHSKKKLSKVAFSCLLGAAFGLTFALTFFITRTIWDKADDTGQTNQDITIHIGEDDMPTTQAQEPSDEDAPSGEYSDIWAAIKPSVDSIVEQQDNESARRKAMNAADRSMVIVTSRSESKDRFNNPVTSAEEAAGVIIAKTGGEILILTSSAQTRGSEIFVNFSNNKEAHATLKGTDDIFGIAVIAVKVTEVSPDTAELPAITVGSFVSAAKGVSVIALGMPQGKADSVAFGIISNVDSTVIGTDAVVRLFQTDISADESANGILLNTDGQMVGWITTRYVNTRVPGVITALSVSDMKASVDNLLNGRKSALLGIRGQTVTAAMSAEYGMPSGIYVSKTVEGRAAELGGVNAGDIITGFGDSQTLLNIAELTSAIMKASPGDEIKLVVYRENGGTYQELTLNITLQNR